MTARWYKRCGADFIHGTMMLTLEEKGAYSLCLDLIYDRGGPIPDDPRWLSGVCGVSMRKWSTLRERLVDLGKLVAGDGLLSNVRADLELVSAELQRRNQAEAGAKGGRKRAENQFNFNIFSDLAQASLKPIDKSRGDKKGPPNPRKRGNEGKHLLPADWELPKVADLPPQARACAEQWSSSSYATHGEAFVSYWRSRRGMNADWRLTWANRIVALHSTVMRDQKFGNAPPAKHVNGGPRNPAEFKRAIAFAEDNQDFERAAELKTQLSALTQKPPDPAVAAIVERTKQALTH